MNTENICHFIPYHRDDHSIHTIHFVLETQPQVYRSLKTESVYKMYYVFKGHGHLHTAGEITPLSEGDIFFSFPACPFAIESGENFEYMYISFLGSRGNMIMDKLNINRHHFLFHHFGHLADFWKSGISVTRAFSDLVSESVLLYTFSQLGERQSSPARKTNEAPGAGLLIKKYIDDHYSDTDFSVTALSRELQYNPKYVSAVFKKTFGIGIIEYLTTIRIQQACTMIEQGFTSVSDIGYRCGFSDPQYFSKVFKKRMGMAPENYRKTHA
ncbi:MAG: helix-turn-helix transcriptional regulator [Lachnospiraceae bacterium]|nr:helix-turn-helix transcriptional regulator [Lachnospiraceae bacterium]